jgi:alpha-amylase
MKKNQLLVALLLLLSAACSAPKRAAQTAGKTPFLWENTNLYFLLTDRFNNGDKSNDLQFGRTKKTGVLRNFMGGDIKGITQKIEDGYFDRLGVTALWFTPVVEQIHESVDEGTGNTYGYHGYWAKDWTALDPNFGTEADLDQLVKSAHARGIRVVLDVVINHTGPVTPQDPLWNDWIRAEKLCTYTSYASTVTCHLVKGLPDIVTESNAPVGLPPFLLEKWKKEGRLEKELAELDAFFQRTGYPRAPRFYVIKWLTDYIRKYGVDGFRCDTAKHVEETVWAELRKEADRAFADWKRTHPDKVLDDNKFYMVGEVYNYFISSGRFYDFGDRKVDFYSNGLDALINFDLRTDAQNPSYEAIFSKYDNILHTTLKGSTVLNYFTSHDDGSPFDKERKKPFEAATKLLLCPGGAQIYYGDETNRDLLIPGTEGDATLRSFMNWEELAANAARNGFKTQDVLAHWQRLGRFRKAHPAVGAGRHTMLTTSPYTFKRVYQSGGYADAVVVGLDLPKGKKTLEVGGVFPDGTALMDYYSGQKLTVSGGKVAVDSDWGVVLLGK